MVHVEQAALRRLEQDLLRRLQSVVQQPRGVADERAQPLGVAAVLVGNRVRLERLRRVLAAGGQRVDEAVLVRHDVTKSLLQVLGVEQLADADGEAAADLVLVARPDAAAGRADGPAVAGALDDPLFFHVVREDDVGVVADLEVGPDWHVGFEELVDLFEQPRRVDHDAVADHRRDPRLQDARRQQRELESAAAPDDRVPGVGPAVVADDEVVVVGEEVDDLALGLVAPLEANHTRRGHTGPSIVE